MRRVPVGLKEIQNPPKSPRILKKKIRKRIPGYSFLTSRFNQMEMETLLISWIISSVGIEWNMSADGRGGKLLNCAYHVPWLLTPAPVPTGKKYSGRKIGTHREGTPLLNLPSKRNWEHKENGAN